MKLNNSRNISFRSQATPETHPASARRGLLVAVALLTLVIGLVTGAKAQVLTTLISAGAEWAYLDSGSDPGTAWHGLSFDDSNWARGAAELGYGDGDEATVVRRGDNQGNVFVTTYFRKVFTVADPAAVSNLVVQFKRDDGAIGYLNGVEVFRSNMPTGMITGFTYAAAPVAGTNELLFTAAPINPSLLKSGQNVLAVEVHQFQDTGNDLSFDLKLDAEILTLSMPPQILQPPFNQVATVGGTAIFSVVASGTEPLTYQWKHDGVPLPGFRFPGLTNPPVQIQDAGSYTVTVSNAFGVTESTPATLTVLMPPPVSVSGRVTDPAGQPVDGVTLVINGPTRQSVLSDPDGTYAFHGLRYGGSYVIAVGDTNLIATPAGLNLSPLTNSTVANFTVSTPYQGWQATYLGGNSSSALTDPNADPDGDGKPNLIEFAMGSNPMTADTESGIGIRMIGTNGTAHPVISLKLNPQARDLIIGVEVASNLVQPIWTTLCRRGAEAYEGEMGPSIWGALPQLSPDSPHVAAFEETLDGVDIHLSVVSKEISAFFVKWWAAAPPATTPGLVIAPPSLERKNHTLLVGFNNFQRMPEIVRTAIDRGGNPLGYLSDKVAARRFASRVLKGGYDIIALAEVWTDEAKNWVEHDLKLQYPHYVKQLDVGGGVANGYGQDSGLMLFSKLPFADLPPGPATAPTGLTLPETLARFVFLNGIVARANGANWTGVGFVPFEGDCYSEDCLSNKGAGMVQVHDPVAGRDYTVVFTHLNGPHYETDDDRFARNRQLGRIRDMVIGSYGEPPFPNSVLVLGDFNINGDLANTNRTEWTSHFGTADALGDDFKDTWEEQSHQELVSTNWRDRGLTCSPLSPGARYDYLLTHQGRANSLVVQHMARALNLRWPLSAPGAEPFNEYKVAFGTAGNQDLSDHFGIIAYIHPGLDSSHAGQTPASAIPISATTTESPDGAVQVYGNISVAGQMQWFLLPEPGIYTISLESGVDFTNDVFSSQDLSQQIMDTGSFRWLEYGSPPTKTRGLTYASPFRPLFIRVQHKDPQRTGHFQLVIRKHQGASKDDAIPLAPNAGQLHTNSIPAGTIGTPERWFIIATEEARSGQPQRLVLNGEPLVEGDDINHSMELQSEDGTVVSRWTVARSPATHGHEEMWSAKANLYLRVVPQPGAGVKSIRVGWSTDLTVLLAAGTPLAQFGLDSTNVSSANLVITEGTDSGVVEDEESIRMSWVLSRDPAVMSHSVPITGTDAIDSRLDPVLVAREIAPGQSAVASFVFPELRFLTNEVFEVQCTEWDDGSHSLLKGRIWSLDRAEFCAPMHKTHLTASEDRTEYYTLTTSLAHGTRWFSYGHH